MNPVAKWVYVPAAQIHFNGDDSGKTGYIAGWLAKAKAAEAVEKSTRRNGQWTYKVANEFVWLDADTFRSFIEAQLPADLAVHCQRVKDRVRDRELERQEYEQKRAAKIAAEIAGRPAELAAQQKASEAAKAKVLAKLNALPGWTGVDVRYVDWTKDRTGKTNRHDRVALNVTVRQSGKRAYIIGTDGTSFIKSIDNVQMTDATGNLLRFAD